MGGVFQNGLGVSGLTDCSQRNVMELPQVGPQGFSIAKFSGTGTLLQLSC